MQTAAACSLSAGGTPELKLATMSGSNRAATPPTRPTADKFGFEPKDDAFNDHLRDLRNGVLAEESSRATELDTDAIDSALMRELHRSQVDSANGASPHRKRQRVQGDRSVLSRSMSPSPAFANYFVSDSSRLDLAKTSKPALASCMTRDHLLLPQGRKSEHHMASFIFRKVSRCRTLLILSHANNFLRSRGSKQNILKPTSRRALRRLCAAV